MKYKGFREILLNLLYKILRFNAPNQNDKMQIKMDSFSLHIFLFLIFFLYPNI